MHIFSSASILLLAGVALCCATPVTYTIQGTGNGAFWPTDPSVVPTTTPMPFAAQPFSLSFTVDTSSVSPVGPGAALVETPVVSSVYASVGSVSGYLAPTVSEVGLLEDNGTISFFLSAPINETLTIANSEFLSYDLASSIGPVSGLTTLNQNGRGVMAQLIPINFNNAVFEEFYSVSDVTFQAQVNTPEPASLTLIGIACLGLGVFSRRRRS